MILYVAAADTGGIAEYSIQQVNALERAGVPVTVLCSREFPAGRLKCSEVLAQLPTKRESPTRIGRWLAGNRQFRQIAAMVDRLGRQGDRFDYILIDCFREYFSILWYRPYLRLARSGKPIGIVAHDPIRNLSFGPRWWHNLSIRRAYSFVRDVFVHDARRIDFGGPRPSRIRVHQIPHGTYNLNDTGDDRGNLREATRARLGIPSSSRVFLSFGHIRDDKNLDLFIRSLKGLDDEVRLLVAGRTNSDSQKGHDYYLQLARDLGVAARCHWLLDYIPDEEVSAVFSAADYSLLLYARTFSSASGVLNTAVAFDLPVLASGGEGPLHKCLEEYRLGVWVPDLTEAGVRNGVQKLITGEPYTDFQRYREANSWDRNAALVRKAMESG